MKNIILKSLKFIFPIIDILLIPFVFLSWIIMIFIRRSIFAFWSKPLFLSKKILLKIWVFPIINHYYEPKFIYSESELKKIERKLPWIDLWIKKQLDLINEFDYANELSKFPMEKTDKLEYYFNNYNFWYWDAEYLYSIIRHFKPKNIIEIGSWFSTLMTIEAIKENIIKNKDYICKHTCIEPF